MTKKGAVLITGGAGYIGSHIGFVLAGYGYQVVLLDNAPKNTIIAPEWGMVVHGDYGDAQLLTQLFTQFPICSVVHCASLTSDSESLHEPLRYYDNNVAKTLVLVERMLHHKVFSLVFSSSCAVYGHPQTVPITETHPLQPVSPYGATKMMVERLLTDCGNATPLKSVSLRYFNVAGSVPGLEFAVHQNKNYVIPRLLDAARYDKPFYLFGSNLPTVDGTCVRDYVHVQDIADAHYKALLYLEKGNGSDVFNVGTGKGWSVQELINAAQQITGKEIQVIKKEQRLNDPAILVADARKSTALLGWQPHYSHLEYCLKTVWG